MGLKETRIRSNRQGKALILLSQVQSQSVGVDVHQDICAEMGRKRTTTWMENLSQSKLRGKTYLGSQQLINEVSGQIKLGYSQISYFIYIYTGHGDLRNSLENVDFLQGNIITC